MHMFMNRSESYNYLCNGNPTGEGNMYYGYR